MAQAFKTAEEKVSTARVKANGYRDGNVMRSACNTLKDSLIAAGVTSDAAWRLATSWESKNSKAP